MIKRYKQFINENDIYVKEEILGKLIRVKFSENSLKLFLTEEGIEMVQDNENLDESDFVQNYFEDIQVNSDIEYISNLGEAGFGLTDAPGFIVGYDMDDNGEYIETPESKLYYYNEYAIHNFLEILREDEYVIFTEQK